MRKAALSVLILAVVQCAAQTQPDISGLWVGSQKAWQTDTSDLKATLLGSPDVWIAIEKAGTGEWTASLRESAHPQDLNRVTSITLDGSNLRFNVDALNLHFTGTVSANGSTIEGAASLRGFNYQLQFRRAFLPRSITVRDLGSVIGVIGGEPDSKAAEQIYDLKLTERLSDGKLMEYEEALRGDAAKTALKALADASGFLDLPNSEVPKPPEPNVIEQRTMIAKTVAYVADTVHRLPNFYATRTTTTFQRKLWSENAPVKLSAKTFSGSQMFLHVVGKSSVTVQYRKGEEHRRDRKESGVLGLTTSGEFGPILGTVMLDAATGHLSWSHWESGASVLQAVYRYAVDQKDSHYKVEGERTAYDGEIAIDPVTGAVLRLVLRANTGPASPLIVAQILVEYGPVLLGGKAYICPVKSVALSQGFATFWLNDVVFHDYHLFRSTSRILPDVEEAH